MVNARLDETDMPTGDGFERHQWGELAVSFYSDTLGEDKVPFFKAIAAKFDMQRRQPANFKEYAYKIWDAWRGEEGALFRANRVLTNGGASIGKVITREPVAQIGATIFVPAGHGRMSMESMTDNEGTRVLAPGTDTRLLQAAFEAEKTRAQQFNLIRKTRPNLAPDIYRIDPEGNLNPASWPVLTKKILLSHGFPAELVNKLDTNPYLKENLPNFARYVTRPYTGVLLEEYLGPKDVGFIDSFTLSQKAAGIVYDTEFDFTWDMLQAWKGDEGALFRSVRRLEDAGIPVLKPASTVPTENRGVTLSAGHTTAAGPFRPADKQIDALVVKVPADGGDRRVALLRELGLVNGNSEVAIDYLPDEWNVAQWRYLAPLGVPNVRSDAGSAGYVPEPTSFKEHLLQKYNAWMINIDQQPIDPAVENQLSLDDIKKIAWPGFENQEPVLQEPQSVHLNEGSRIMQVRQAATQQTLLRSWVQQVPQVDRASKYNLLYSSQIMGRNLIPSNEFMAGYVNAPQQIIQPEALPEPVLPAALRVQMHDVMEPRNYTEAVPIDPAKFVELYPDYGLQKGEAVPMAALRYEWPLHAQLFWRRKLVDERFPFEEPQASERFDDYVSRRIEDWNTYGHENFKAISAANGQPYAPYLGDWGNEASQEQAALSQSYNTIDPRIRQSLPFEEGQRLPSIPEEPGLVDQGVVGQPPQQSVLAQSQVRFNSGYGFWPDVPNPSRILQQPIIVQQPSDTLTESLVVSQVIPGDRIPSVIPQGMGGSSGAVRTSVIQTVSYELSQSINPIPLPEQQFSASGFDLNGYNRDGYDRQGFNRDGYNRDGLDANYRYAIPKRQLPMNLRVRHNVADPASYTEARPTDLAEFRTHNGAVQVAEDGLVDIEMLRHEWPLHAQLFWRRAGVDERFDVDNPNTFAGNFNDYVEARILGWNGQIGAEKEGFLLAFEQHVLRHVLDLGDGEGGEAYPDKMVHSAPLIQPVVQSQIGGVPNTGSHIPAGGASQVLQPNVSRISGQSIVQSQIGDVPDTWPGIIGSQFFAGETRPAVQPNVSQILRQPIVQQPNGTLTDSQVVVQFNQEPVRQSGIRPGNSQFQQQVVNGSSIISGQINDSVRDPIAVPAFQTGLRGGQSGQPNQIQPNPQAQPSVSVIRQSQEINAQGRRNSVVVQRVEVVGPLGNQLPANASFWDRFVTWLCG
ncbi:MAG: hypothetical protein KF874_02740 [Rhizobiaceae bacterium]|nr:hypothetical protein [Rhizobiaceae bacterium]